MNQQGVIKQLKSDLFTLRIVSWPDRVQKACKTRGYGMCLKRHINMGRQSVIGTAADCSSVSTGRCRFKSYPAHHMRPQHNGECTRPRTSVGEGSNPSGRTTQRRGVSCPRRPHKAEIVGAEPTAAPIKSIGSKRVINS